MHCPSRRRCRFPRSDLPPRPIPPQHPDRIFSRFRRSNGWKVGVDGSVAIVTIGVGGAIDTNQLKKPVLGFILDNKGLMYNLTLEGSKITRINK